MVKDSGADGAVVMATGYVVVSVGSVHVDPEEQAAVGAVVAASEVTLPVVTNVVAFGSVTVPVVNVVAVTVTCQPAPLPVASSTRYDWCATVGSTICWSTPLPVVDQARAVGEVRVREPASTPRVPVSVQGVPAAMAVPHTTAWAVPAVARTDAPTPPVRSRQTPRKRPRRPLAIGAVCLIECSHSIVATICSWILTHSSFEWHARHSAT